MCASKSARAVICAPWRWRAEYMDLDKIIKNLQKERLKLDQLITSLEQLQTSAAARQAEAPKKRRGRKSMDSKGRQEVSERMKMYWATRRAERLAS